MIFSFLFIYIFVVNIVFYVVHIVCEVDVIANSLVLYLPFCSTLNTNFFSSSSSTSPTNNRLASQPTATAQRRHAHKPFKIINTNFQNIKSKTVELGNFISESDPDILIGTETWLNHSITDNEFFPPGYTLPRKDRQDGYGGGGTTSH